MRILHIARWASARVYKQVLCQQGAGWNVTLMAGSTPHVGLHGLVVRRMGWCPFDVLERLAFDVVVFHTTISTAHETMPRIAPRMIWDCHDYVGNVYNGFDAVTCPSRGMADKFDNGCVVYSKVPAMLWPTWSERYIDAVVFQGTMGNGEAWGDYEGLEARIGRPVFFYPSGDVIEGHKRCKLMRRVSYAELLSVMSEYAIGYAGASREDVTIDDCVTNKYWEYIAAGLPVMLYNSEEMSQLSLGYSPDRGAMRNAIMAYKHSFTMEAEIGKMKEAYEFSR